MYTFIYKFKTVLFLIYMCSKVYIYRSRRPGGTTLCTRRLALFVYTYTQFLSNSSSRHQLDGRRRKKNSMGNIYIYIKIYRPNVVCVITTTTTHGVFIIEREEPGITVQPQDVLEGKENLLFPSFFYELVKNMK